MSTYFTTVPVTNFLDSVHRGNMISAVRNAFLSCSFVRTVQSGSVDNPYTLGNRSAANQDATYDIFAFDDAWQATHPLFIRVKYRSGTATNSIALTFQMGTAHNDSGSLIGGSTLTEIIGTNTAVTTATSGSSVFASGDGSYLSLMTFPEQVQISQLAVFERLYDASGNPTGSGFHMAATNAATTNKAIHSHAAFWGSAPGVQEVNALVSTRPSKVPPIYNGRLILGLVYPMIGVPQNPSPNILVGSTGEASELYTAMKYSVYGTERSYVSAGSTFDNVNSRTAPSGRYLIRSNV
jgi:hypothetical protein